MSELHQYLPPAVNTAIELIGRHNAAVVIKNEVERDIASFINCNHKIGISGDPISDLKRFIADELVNL